MRRIVQRTRILHYTIVVRARNYTIMQITILIAHGPRRAESVDSNKKPER